MPGSCVDALRTATKMPIALCRSPVRADTDVESCRHHVYHQDRRPHQIAIALAARPVPNFPRLRALALFGRRLVECAERLSLPASKNQHKTGYQLSAAGCPLVRHPLGEVCPALTASTTMRMAWMTIGALSIMMLCPECVSVMCTAPGTIAASSFWAAAFARSMTAPRSGGVSGGSSPAWMSFGTTSTYLSLAVSTTT